MLVAVNVKKHKYYNSSNVKNFFYSISGNDTYSIEASLNSGFIYDKWKIARYKRQKVI